jgi:hypothetical protein
MPQFVFGLLLIAFAAVVGFYGTQVAREGWTKMFSPPRAEATAGRPYVVVASTELVIPADHTEPVQVVFDLKNTGQTEAVGTLRDFTYYFSTDAAQREFAYQHSESIPFSLAPGEQWRGHFLPSFVLSNEKLEALDAGRARLFVYARGEYRDPAGRVFPFPFARMYHPVVAGKLAISPRDIVFK